METKNGARVYVGGFTVNENEMKENSSLFSRNAPRMEGMDQHLACLICAMRLHPSSPFDHGLSTTDVVLIDS